VKRSHCDSEVTIEDLYSCSFLALKGHQVLGVIRTSPNRAAVRFLKTPAIEKDIFGYFNGDTVPAIRLFESLRNIKQAVFQFTQNHRMEDRLYTNA